MSINILMAEMVVIHGLVSSPLAASEASSWVVEHGSGKEKGCGKGGRLHQLRKEALLAPDLLLQVERWEKPGLRWAVGQ